MGRTKSEYEVEEMFIKRLSEMNYDYVELKDYDDVKKNFREQFCLLNKDKLIEKKGEAKLSDKEFDRILLRLEGKSIYESAKILRNQYILDLDNVKQVYVEFFTEDPNKNIYQVTHQVTMDEDHMSEVERTNRYDVTVLINGLPLVQIELKRPGIEINQAINQINRYRRYSFKGLFRYIQIFVVSNSTYTKYFANMNENDINGKKQDILKSLVFLWTNENNEKISKIIDFTNDFFKIVNITEILSKYFVINETQPLLMVMRPYQIYAVKKSLDRVLRSNTNGFVFHTTGSGKTLTSYKLASTLKNSSQIDKVIFLIDRKDLDEQTVEEYNSFEKDCVDNTDNTYTLIKALKSESDNQLIITTIQKMNVALSNSKYENIMAPYKNKRVVFIIDECHRSQFGEMNAKIKKHFTNANFIGFTGTPIFKENKGKDGRTTADVFKTPTGIDSCIHKYMIKEAIADGNVLRFSVEYMSQINRNKSSIVKIDGKQVDMSKIDDPVYCKANNIDLQNIYHNDDRIAAVAEDILNRLSTHTRPEGKDVYTAIFATDKIKYLLKYYRYMRKHNPNNYKIAAIFTYKANEDLEDEGLDEFSDAGLLECMNDYNEMFGTQFDLSSFDSYRKDVSNRMKQRNLPQIDLLLVVNMFLTGFDSRATNTLILDKNLEWHSLVQAYSRTNRVYKVTKQFGQIINYRNIKKAQDEALRLYSGDGNPNEFLLQNYEYYLAKYSDYTDEIRKVASHYEDAINLQSEDDIKDYIVAFRKISSTLATLKTFSKFDWDDLGLFMDEEEYSHYKSCYLEFYDKVKHGNLNQTILVDIDFEIELVKTDKINVIYIINLLNDINRKDKKNMEHSIDLIIREIDRSDNEKLRYKSEMMKSFITDRFFDLDPEMDVFEAYSAYEKELLSKDIDNFCKNERLDKTYISNLVYRYFSDSKSVLKDSIREMLMNRGFGLVDSTIKVDKIMKYVQDMYNKYSNEGE